MLLNRKSEDFTHIFHHVFGAKSRVAVLARFLSLPERVSGPSPVPGAGRRAVARH